MRRVVYQALLRAPFQIVSATGGVVGFIGSVWPEKVKAVIGEGIPIQPMSIALLVAALGYFVLLWLLKPGERGNGGGGHPGPTITTGGPNSSGFGNVGGNVTISHHHAPPEPQSPEPRVQYIQPAVYEALKQAMAPIVLRPRPTGGVERAERLAERYSTPPVQPKPDIPLNGILGRIYKKLGPPPAPEDLKRRQAFEAKVDQEIANTVSVERLSVWGHLQGVKQPIKRISLADWNRSELNHKRGSLFIDGGRWPSTTYVDLRFSKAEIDRVWPKSS